MELILVVVISAGMAENSQNGVSRSSSGQSSVLDPNPGCNTILACNYDYNLLARCWRVGRSTRGS